MQAEAHRNDVAESLYVKHMESAEALWVSHNLAGFLSVSSKALLYRMDAQQAGRHASAELSLGRCIDAMSKF